MNIGVIAMTLEKMDLTNIATIKKLCRDFGILPSRKRGQNFLADKKVLDKMIESAILSSDDTVLEVGPGLGTITQALLKKVRRVVACEIDKKMAGVLMSLSGHYRNLEIIQDDILELRAPSLGLKTLNFKIAANLPYNITSYFLRKFLSQEPKPLSMVLLVQKEVAERICAKPGKMSLLSVSVQAYAKPEIIEVVPRKSFWPEPEVDSAIIKIKDIKTRLNINEKDFFRIVRIGFSSRRKMLKNNLAAGLRVKPSVIEKVLEEAGLDRRIRAQELSVSSWMRLTELSAEKPGSRDSQSFH